MAKRMNGEGTVAYNDDRKRWEGRLTVAFDDDGKPITKSPAAPKAK